MKKNQPVIVIFGAGGIGEAVSLLLAEYGDPLPRIYIGDRYQEQAKKVVAKVEHSTTRSCKITPFVFNGDTSAEALRSILEEGNVLLDCLPGSLAPKMARLAIQYELHYANLTEYVAETETIVSLASNANTGFLLQTGLAPGFVNVAGHRLFRQFCRRYGVDRADRLEMRTGALTQHAVSPHFYGFTWSPVGVATEYVKDAVVVRDHRISSLPALSERDHLIINGRPYEADLTSGGAADIPQALGSKIRNIDYKTLRYPGHYDWIKGLLSDLRDTKDRIRELQAKMEARIPHLEEDQVLIFLAVEGPDREGVKRRIEKTYQIGPTQVGNYRLRAIQASTAAPLAEAAYYLLENSPSGIVFQSDLDPDDFLGGRFVKGVYGE